MPTDYDFTGQRLDRETGLLSYGARSYDPLSGRFTQADLRQNNVVGMDPYEYVGQNPQTETDPTGQYFVPGGGNGSGSPPPRPTPPPAGPPSSQPSCTIYDCSVTLNHQTYSLGDILTDLNQRRNFLTEFYNVLATGFGVAELAFFDYLLKSGRLKDLEGYWNNVDYDLVRDQLLAAYDYLHNQGAQNPFVAHWLAFLAHPGDNAWWLAHNDSINAGDEQARADGVYEKENPVEQIFINQAVHVINDIQYVSQFNGNLSSWLGPRSPTTGNLAGSLDPQQNDAWTTGIALFRQGVVAGAVGGATGIILGAASTRNPVGAIIGGVFGITVGEMVFQSLLNPTS
jgi:RHS repeat-associated protein